MARTVRGTPRDAEARLAALARAPAPLRRALARIAGRVVATRSWERLGFARLEDYAAERAGMSARELRDLAHVDRALAALPALDAALRTGELGWTQVRLLCRVARPDDERVWLAMARQCTARALAREVRAVDRSAEANEEERRVAVTLRCMPAVRARWWHARQLAHRVAGRALSAEEFVEAITAEVLSAAPLQDAPGEPDAKQEPEEDGSAPGEVRVEAPDRLQTGVSCASAEMLESGLDTADAFELDARLCRAVRLEARHLARLAAQLDFVVSHGLHRELGFSGLDDYARDRLGMAPSRARALLRIERAALRWPALRAAFASGRLSWVQAHALIPLVFEPAAARHCAKWLAHAERVSVRRLRDDVELALATGDFAPGSRLQTGAIARSHEARARVSFTAAPEVASLFRAALAMVQRRLRGSLSEAVDAMLAHAVDTWCAGKTDHRVFDRDGWRCTVPGCSSYRSLHAHHIVFRSAGGGDELVNLTTLCAWHHQRGIHAGLVHCTGQAPHALRFELGRRSRRAPLLVFGPGEVRMN
jgi:hypothetical protein